MTWPIQLDPLYTYFLASMVHVSNKKKLPFQDHAASVSLLFHALLSQLVFLLRTFIHEIFSLSCLLSISSLCCFFLLSITTFSSLSRRIRSSLSLCSCSSSIFLLLSTLQAFYLLLLLVHALVVLSFAYLTLYFLSVSILLFTSSVVVIAAPVSFVLLFLS